MEALHNQGYKFTTDFFDSNSSSWKCVIDSLKPEKYLEIGTFEGKSLFFLIESLGLRNGGERSVEVHCCDTWGGGIEHKKKKIYEMDSVEQTFLQNLSVAKNKFGENLDAIIHKECSSSCLPRLLADGKRSYFDMIYIDGSHQAADVLFDAVVSFELLKEMGVLIFDDYLWHEKDMPDGIDVLRSPKIAIDSFLNIYARKIKIIDLFPLRQIYVYKIQP